jgi:hypothetical protein
MKKVIIALVIAIIGAAGYYAYKRFLSTDDLVKSIPEDAIFVVTIDPKSIATKAGGKEIGELKMF